MDASKFQLPVDADNKATTIRLWNFSRPHMRVFHFAWFSFFLAFTGWFALPPLLTTIRVSMDLCSNGNWETLGPNAAALCQCGPVCRTTIAQQNGVAVAGTILMRLLVGGWAETYGPRFSQCFLIMVFAVPLALSGLSTSMAALTAARFFIGGIGATFVITMYWTSVMFSKNVVGTANATTAGWGNLGGGAAQAIMPALLIAIERTVSKDQAWRYVPIIPAGFLFVTGVAVYLFSDDVPQGTYKALYASGERKKQNPWKMFLVAARDPRVWIAHLAYGGCFGTELVMNNQLVIYFKDYFGASREVAGLASSLFGAMNLFARSAGGILSDIANKYFGHRGRHWVYFFTQLGVGVMMILFSIVPKEQFKVSLFVVTIFSAFVQAAEGASFAIVPYQGAHLKALGPVSGIVGAGGNVGAVLWSFTIHATLASAADLSLPFRVHGAAVIGTALFLPFMHYNALGSMFFPQTDFSEEQPDAAPAKPTIMNANGPRV